MILLHADELILTRLLKSLRVQFANQTPVLKLLDEYLMVRVTRSIMYLYSLTRITIFLFYSTQLLTLLRCNVAYVVKTLTKIPLWSSTIPFACFGI